MADLLFEIGTEELPPALINSLTDQITGNITAKLKENELPFNEADLRKFYTARRIAIYIPNLPEKQETKKIEVKGPDKSKAFNESGLPTQAAIGFAKKYNLEPKDLILKKVNDTEYVFVSIQTGGKETKELLAKILPESIYKTSGEKFMKWGSYEETFARPIRWIVSLLDNKIIDFTYAGIKSNSYSFGHRFLSNKEIKIETPRFYEKTLEENHIIPSQEKRKRLIEELIDKEAKTVDGIPIIEPVLLEEVVNITENPQSLLCSFDDSFLSLPGCIIETVLRKHQRYFVLTNSKDKTKLLKHFVVITNGTEKNNEIFKSQIKKGNEKVVRARLNDAKFFFEDDLKEPFNYEVRATKLSKIGFQKGLSSMLEKVNRILQLSIHIYEKIKEQAKEKFSLNKEDLTTAIKLCKLDLTTKMVFEMPELQGTIGSIYAKQNGYPKNISESIEEHYFNTNKNNILAQIIGITDKLDNIICLFSINKIPSGSADPFALRGQTSWIFANIEAIQEQYNIDFRLKDLIYTFKEKVTGSEIKSKVTNETINKIQEFLTERLKLIYKSSTNTTNDIVEATFTVSDPLNNIRATKEKIELLNKHFINPNEKDKAFYKAAQRLVRIVEQNTNGNLDLSNLKLDAEMELLKRLKEISSKEHKDSNELLLDFYTLTNPINNFFEKVLVNDPDPKTKQARQALLKKGKELFENICDFNKITERS